MKKAVFTLIFCLNAVIAFCGNIEYEISNTHGWKGVVTCEKTTGRVWGYLIPQNKPNDDIVIVKGSFYGKGLIRVSGKTKNGHVINEILSIENYHESED